MKLIRCGFIAAMLAGAALHAEETVHWNDLAAIVNASKPNGSQEYTVVTRIGETIRSRDLWVTSTGLRIPFPGTLLRPDQVLEIQIRHRGRFNYFGWIGNKLCPEPLSCGVPIVLVILPVDWAFGAVATPPLLLVERSRRRRAPRILKILP